MRAEACYQEGRLRLAGKDGMQQKEVEARPFSAGVKSKNA
jgi:hypothetical protein